MDKQEAANTAASATAAEVVALSDCVKNVRLKYWIAEELGEAMEWPAVINVDNTAAISFQKGMNPDSKLKGVFDLRSGWLKDMRRTDQFETRYIGTSKNLADAKSKPLKKADRDRLEEERLKLVHIVISEYKEKKKAGG